MFASFEELPGDLIKNTNALGFDLDGLFIRLGAATRSARRVVPGTHRCPVRRANNLGILRAELHRLVEWLKDRGVTTIVTAERGSGALTRHGVEGISLRLRSGAWGRRTGGLNLPNRCSRHHIAGLSINI